MIDGLPNGLDTPCHERGVTLSSGERQLIALARAFLASPRVLILDEATSSLDLATESLVEGALDVLLEGRTAVLIAHRLNTAMRADRIAVVEEGGLVEVGSHAELLALGRALRGDVPGVAAVARGPRARLVSAVPIDGVGAEALPRAVASLQEGIGRGLHLGAQLWVEHDGALIADLATGEQRPGRPMTRDAMFTWWSMTKPTVAVSALQQWERGAFDLDDPVVRFVPEFGAHGKDRITMRHLFTHTAGFRAGDRVQSRLDDPAEWWDEMIAGMCAVELDEGWSPGARAGYHLNCGVMMLAEVVRRVDGRPFARYVREEVFEPLGMTDCWVGMPVDRYEAYGERIGTMHETANPANGAVPLDYLDTAYSLSRGYPGGGGRGPMHQYAQLYRALARGGVLDDVRILSPQTVAAMTARHRVGMFDETLNVAIDWGLGVQVDGYSTGRYASPRAFGHGGARSSFAFVDPEHALVVAVQVNGMCANVDHYARFSDANSAIYLDLGLADDATPVREKPMSQEGTLV